MGTSHFFSFFQTMVTFAPFFQNNNNPLSTLQHFLVIFVNATKKQNIEGNKV
jgi:hypothetical protein